LEEVPLRVIVEFCSIAYGRAVEKSELQRLKNFVKIFRLQVLQKSQTSTFRNSNDFKPFATSLMTLHISKNIGMCP
jgi:hypothetical protein